MKDSICVIEVGTHPGPYWVGKDGRLGPVCSRHRSQYEERADEFGPFEWEPFNAVACDNCGHDESVHRMTGACVALADTESEHTLCACNEFRPAEQPTEAG